ncbi:MAG: DUF3464 family protein [Oscillatoriales cyanobacterium RM2_1_1]|nr:DUF3464 family protein [Oscillatoriales cyanobacterium SM2_3_0]NJO46400.1 DUF3464 family protein [Oscillatoriales cyanobacterium RM2_1_1]
MAAKPPRQRLPFEPAKSSKKPRVKSDSAADSSASNSPASNSPASKQKTQTSPRPPKQNSRPEDRAIPEVVSRRMIARIATFSGVPLFMGMGSFVGSYLVIKNELFPLPSSAVLLVSLGCFGLSVLGVTYGVLSASWEPENSGSWLGLPEFRINLGRTWESIREARQLAKAKRERDRNR